jgi:glycerate kinase
VRVVIAPDSFKGSIAAPAAAAALAGGWRALRPADQVLCLPLADGGEGTLDVLAAAVPDARWHHARVSGPGTDLVDACWLELPGGTGAIELAAASGLPLLAAADPLGAHTAGTGELAALALDAGMRRLVIALGGSASTDGGTGALAALGARFLGAGGRELPRGGGALAALHAVELSGLRPPPPGGGRCLTDVRAPLLGPGGAAAVFGPQKGADGGQVAVLEAGLARLATLLGGDPAAPGAGAAGGAGYGFAAAWGAVIEPGAPEVARLAGLPQALAGAGLVITGEGCYDETSRLGKVTGTVMGAAAAAGVPVALAAGRISCRPPPGTTAVELVSLARDLAGGGGETAALAEPGRWLDQAGRVLAAAVP